MSEPKSVQAATLTEPWPAPKGYSSWNDYWAKEHNQPWRTEPEIDEERRRYLAEHRAVLPDMEQGIYPFKDTKLDRADVEWLLAMHESRGRVGPVWWAEEKDKAEDERRVGLDLRGADLREALLGGLPLARIRGSLAHSEFPPNFVEQPDLEMPRIPLLTAVAVSASANLEEADLHEAHLEHALLNGVRLRGAWLRAAHLEGAELAGATLEANDIPSSVMLGTPCAG